VRDADLAVLALEIDPRRVDLTRLQLGRLPEIIALAFCLQSIFGNDSGLPVGNSLDAHQLASLVCDPDQAQLGVLRPDSGDRQEDLPQLSFPPCHFRTVNLLGAVRLQRAVDPLDAGYCGEKKHVTL
jgi:hypothetical protein